MITRRDALICSAGLLSASLAGPASAFSAAPDASIVLQESFVFPQWQAAMAAEQRDFEAPPRDSGGIRVVSLAAPGVSRLPVELAADFAVMANDQLAQAVSASAGRMMGLATVSMRHPEAAAREVERAVSTLGFRGVVLQSHESGALIDEPRFNPLFETLSGLKVPLLLQSPYPSGSGPHGHETMSGASADAALPLIRMMFAGSFDRWPDLKVIVGLGEAGLYWSQKMSAIYRNLQADGDPLPLLHPRDYLARNVFSTTAGMQSLAALEAAHEIYGAQSVLLSMTDESHGRSIKSLASAGLDDAQRRSLDRETALLAFAASARA